MAEDHRFDFVIVLDGNDGVGKSTVTERLRAMGFTARDRGHATAMTDMDPIPIAHGPDPREIHFILDAPIAVSRQRLAKAGKDLSEKYHTVEDLTYYREQFLRVAGSLTSCYLVDATRPVDEVVQIILLKLDRHA